MKKHKKSRTQKSIIKTAWSVVRDLLFEIIGMILIPISYLMILLGRIFFILCKYKIIVFGIILYSLPIALFFLFHWLVHIRNDTVKIKDWMTFASGVLTYVGTVTVAFIAIEQNKTTRALQEYIYKDQEIDIKEKRRPILEVEGLLPIIPCHKMEVFYDLDSSLESLIIKRVPDAIKTDIDYSININENDLKKRSIELFSSIFQKPEDCDVDEQIYLDQYILIYVLFKDISSRDGKNNISEIKHLYPYNNARYDRWIKNRKMEYGKRMGSHFLSHRYNQFMLYSYSNGKIERIMNDVIYNDRSETEPRIDIYNGVSKCGCFAIPYSGEKNTETSWKSALFYRNIFNECFMSVLSITLNYNSEVIELKCRLSKQYAISIKDYEKCQNPRYDFWLSE